MNQKEIIELAGHRHVPQWVIKLVGDAVEKERKEFTEHAVEIARRAIKAEREACAELIEPKNDPSDWTEYARIKAACAAAIRARKD